MFDEEYSAVTKAAKAKSDFLKNNPTGYFISSVLAGIFIAFGVILVFTISGAVGPSPWTKVIMGASFTVALSLVVMAGGELFTGNNLVMCSGSCCGTVSWADTARLWVVCYMGNWAGSLLAAFLYQYTGLYAEPIQKALAAASYAKMSVPLGPLFVRAMLCNMLVCLAVWCGTRCKSESGKLIMIFWCIYAFFTSGFEHSIANMSLLALGLMAPHGAEISIGGYFYNLSVVTVGNMVGGILLVSLPYFAISRKKDS